MTDIAFDFIKTKVLRGFSEIENLYRMVTERGGYICGGYARYCASPRPKPISAGDVDIYCKDITVFHAIKRELDQWLSVQCNTPVGIFYRKAGNNSRRQNFENNSYFSCPQIQLIEPMREGRLVSDGTLEEILANFDFSVVRAGFVSPTEILVDVDFIQDELDNKLQIKNIHCPVSSSLRIAKYITKGYKIRPIEVLKLFIDWDNRGPEYRERLVSNLERLRNDQVSYSEWKELYKLMMID